MNKKICAWAAHTYPDYITYHNKEWGVPVHEDKIHFEFLTLEGAQAGLSWRTILNKREGYRDAFVGFNVLLISKFTSPYLESLTTNPNIVRNRLKIASVVKNAKAFIRIQKEFGSFDAYVWRFVDHQPIQGAWHTKKEGPVSQTNISLQLSKDLKKRGFNFVGSTIMYAYMQAIGMVNDHGPDCYRYPQIKALTSS
jgi:DNA-3-methyladenine glycosylase I|tara:strand:- start:2545 stop:3132 length:588 start_codon:yes stop_codon:yes gene_type:complete